MLIELAIALALLHPDSESSSVLVVEGRTATWQHRIQVASLSDALPGIDYDYDGELSAAELRDARAALERYVGEHWRIVVDEAPATSTLLQLAPSEVAGYVVLERRLVATRSLRRFELVVDPFAEKDPWHRSLVEVRFGDRPPWPVAFGAGVTRREVVAPELRRRFTFLDFAARGARRAFVLPHFAALLGLALVRGASLRTAAAFLGAVVLAGAASLLGFTAPLPFTALFVPGAVVLLAGEMLLTKEPFCRAWTVPALGAGAALALAAALAPYPVTSDVRASANVGQLVGWTATTLAAGAVEAR
ncbi:MAG: hypothetical protein WD226_09220, partial [Planctomycetota bacterium]